jgi:hypothetical protein
MLTCNFRRGAEVEADGEALRRFREDLCAHAGALPGPRRLHTQDGRRALIASTLQHTRRTNHHDRRIRTDVLSSQLCRVG